MKRTSSHSTLDSSIAVCSVPTKCPKSKTSDDLPSDTEAAILYIHKLFPVSNFKPLPPIILKHQIYSLIHDKTIVDRQIVQLKDSAKIRLIKLDTSQEDYAIIYYNEYCTLISTVLGDTPLLHKVVHLLLPEYDEVSISKQQLTKTFKFSADNISTLVANGVLILKDVSNGESCWWFSIPCVSTFKKDFVKGSKQLLHQIFNDIHNSCELMIEDMSQSTIVQLVKKLKYKEILQSELEKKKLSVTHLPMEYHIHYLIGTELLYSIETTSGSLLRLNE